MNEQEKQLLLQDLCARLLYGVNVQIFSKELDGKVYEYTCELDVEILQTMMDNEDVVYLSYLRPMSSMTEEEQKQFDGKILPNGYVVASNFGFDFLNKNHFDDRGLIPMGLALEAPEDMYNK